MDQKNDEEMKFSGPRIDLSNFLQGWGLVGGSFGKAHYFVRKQGGIIADCGLKFEPKLRDGKGFVFYEPGSFPKCKKCQNG